MNRKAFLYAADADKPKGEDVTQILEDQRKKRRIATRDARLPPEQTDKLKCDQPEAGHKSN